MGRHFTKENTRGYSWRDLYNLNEDFERFLEYHAIYSADIPEREYEQWLKNAKEDFLRAFDEKIQFEEDLCELSLLEME